ncbi:copper resistance protein CopC [Herbidospora daliensis]|uniref:copper resistance protein CopC n=1 Tax=Herbidospora daliensis TaxID=295585 RepID=UPI000783923D|nr:copper resistance protein CopC [Herbidospora daliensis]
MIRPVRRAPAWAWPSATPTWAVVLLAAVVVLLLPGTADAHAVLKSTDPADGQVLAQAPRTITATFNEAISLAPKGNLLLDSTGRPVPAEVRSVNDTVVYTPASTLAEGTYVVSWRVVSADTHPVGGGISFSVGRPSANSVAVPTQVADREVNLLRIGAEVLRYGGVLGFAGLTAFGLFIAEPSVRRSATFARRVRRVRDALAAAAVLGAVVLIPLVKLWQDGTGLGDLFSGSVWPAALSTAPAAAAALLAVGTGLALVAAGRRSPVAAAAGTALALGSLAVVGHTRVYGPGWLVLAADLLHLATAALWVGGLLGLCLLFVPDPDHRTAEVASAVGRFSTAALWLVAGLGVSAVVLWWRIADSVEGLWTTAYGRLVLVKLVLVLAVIGVAAWNRYRLVPAVLVGASRRATLDALRRTVGVEAAGLAVVVAVTGVLVSQTPREEAAATPVAAAPAASSGPKTLTAAVGDAKATMVISPGKRGVNALQLSLVDAEGVPLVPHETPELSVRLPAYELGPFKKPLSTTGKGTYEATVDFPLDGTWTVTLVVRLSEFESPVVSQEVVIP